MRKRIQIVFLGAVLLGFWSPLLAQLEFKGAVEFSCSDGCRTLKFGRYGSLEEWEIRTENGKYSMDVYGFDRNTGRRFDAKFLFTTEPDEAKNSLQTTSSTRDFLLEIRKGETKKMSLQIRELPPVLWTTVLEDIPFKEGFFLVDAREGYDPDHEGESVTNRRTDAGETRVAIDSRKFDRFSISGDDFYRFQKLDHSPTKK